MFVWMLQLAIYLRATLTLLSNFIRRAYLPLLDAGLIYGGMVFLKDFWENYHFNDPDYYEATVLYFNFPLYTLIWLLGVFFSGGYDQRYSLRRLVRGLVVGTVVLLAVYGLLDMDYRFSRALGAVWAQPGP